MGRTDVNSSIGSQWKKIIGEMDAYADKAIKEGNGTALLNLKLGVCK